MRKNRFKTGSIFGVCFATAAFACPVIIAAASPGDATLEAVQLLREGGCGGSLPASRPLDHDASLDRAAALWASGKTLAGATESSGYRTEAAAGVHITGPAGSMVDILKRSNCATIANRGMHDVGIHHRGLETWIVMASRYSIPSRAEAPVLASEALDLVNQARARGARCGTRWFAPVPPVRPSGTLDGVAFGHASDMAQHDYFEHDDLAGRSPADRVRAVGYKETLVGENIAYGVKSAQEAVQGWLDSPGHCENIMDPRFAEMGIAYAPGRAVKHGLYWVQVLAAPRAG